MKIPELLLPAGNMSKLRMAVAYGADAVYVGANGLSMRPDESSFAAEELSDAVDYAHKYGCKLYVAINTLMYNEDFPLIRNWLEETSGIGFDAVIVSDPGAFSLVRELRPDMEIHISTQLSTANSASASFWKQAGASRVVLARECTLKHAAEVARDSGVEVEVFVHGAMCVAVSGRCLLSSHLCGKSGARGECKHSCRWEWDLVEKSRPDETYSILETGRETILLGSTDLCLIEHIPELIESGIVSLKVEGRMKSEYYVASVARVYRDAIDSYKRNPDGYKFKTEWLEELAAVSHRPYATGFAFGYSAEESSRLQAHNKPESTCDVLGFIDLIENDTYTISVKNPFGVGEVVEWIGPADENSETSLNGGKVEIKTINEPSGKVRERSHCGSTVLVTLKDGDSLPEYAILRRRKS